MKQYPPVLPIALLLLFLFVSLSLPGSPAPLAVMRKGPYLLYPGNNSSMTVIWQASCTPHQAAIRWGLTRDCGSGRADLVEQGSGADEHLCAYTIHHCAPGSICFYQVILDGARFEGSFRTAPSASAPALVFYACGDTRGSPEVHDRVLSRLMKDAAREEGRGMTFCLHAGDFVTHGMEESSWDSDYFNRNWKGTLQFLAHLPVMGCLGNHEEQGELFRKYWPYAFLPDKRHSYYSFDYGPLHVCVIDQYTAPFNKGSAQYQWLEHDLTSTLRPWRVVLFHEPAWSAPRGHQDNRAVQRELAPLFERHGVKVVVQGHNHYYARCTVKGIEYLTTGGGGAPLHDPGGTSPTVAKSAAVNHFIRFEIKGKIMTMKALDGEGSLVDAATVTR